MLGRRLEEPHPIRVVPRGEHHGLVMAGVPGAAAGLDVDRHASAVVRGAGDGSGSARDAAPDLALPPAVVAERATSTSAVALTEDALLRLVRPPSTRQQDPLAKRPYRTVPRVRRVLLKIETRVRPQLYTLTQSHLGHVKILSLNGTAMSPGSRV